MAENSKAGERDATANKPGFQAFDPAAIEPYIVKDPEALTVNFARTGGHWPPSALLPNGKKGKR